MHSTLYFYNADEQVTIHSVRTSTRLFKNGRLSLAYQRTGTALTLTATDSQLTPLRVSRENLCLTSRPGVYGYMEFDPQVVPCFKGEYLDPLTHLYFLGKGYRQYHPALMRFGSSDDQSPFERGGINQYAFTSADPVNYSDPTGHSRSFNWKRPVSALGTTYRGQGGKIDGIRYFVSEQRQNQPSTLYVVGHGEPGMIIGNSKKYSAEALIIELKRARLNVSGGPSHIIACYSAAPPWPGAHSFIDEFAKLTGKVSRGYKKPVSAVNYSLGSEQIAVVLTAPPVIKHLLDFSSSTTTARPAAIEARRIRE